MCIVRKVLIMHFSFYKYTYKHMYIYIVDGDHGYVQPDGCLRSECHAASEGVLHEPRQEPSQAGQQKDTEAHLNRSALLH